MTEKTSATTSRHIYDSGIIGNCAYIAHVDPTANIVWLCWPRFDSSYVFGSLIAGEEEGGEFSIQPATDDFESKQYYLENTNVLCTEFASSDGRYRVVDFAPRFKQYERWFKPLMLMRKVERLDGNPTVRVTCRPRGDYGRIEPTTSLGSNHIRFLGFEQPMRLTSSIPLHYIMEDQTFVLSRDHHLALTFGPPLEAPLQSTLEEFRRRTVEYWHRWVARCHIPWFRQDVVIRSALALKLHQFEDTGALIAASTTSLPERPGEGRNWDYRYCWLRDSYYTLSALNHLGHFAELHRFADYIQQLLATNSDRIQPVYSITGQAELTEQILDLPGYRGNQPVRVGNQAHTHIQNDVYGQMMLSILPLYLDRRLPARDRLHAPWLIERVLDYIESTMDDPDAGLWELRNLAFRHCYTFLFHWAGSRAARNVATHLGHDALRQRADALCHEAARHIEACWDDDTKSYTHAIGSPHLDASLLQLVCMHYLDADDPRAHALVDRIGRELSPALGHLYRYQHQDDFGVPGVAFMICSFWYVEALAIIGRVDEAIEAFDALTSCANDLGLLSEDADPSTGSQWGNFPQTYSHVGAINAAFRIAEQRHAPLFF